MLTFSGHEETPNSFLGASICYIHGDGVWVHVCVFHLVSRLCLSDHVVVKYKRKRVSVSWPCSATSRSPSLTFSRHLSGSELALRLKPPTTSNVDYHQCRHFSDFALHVISLPLHVLHFQARTHQPYGRLGQRAAWSDFAIRTFTRTCWYITSETDNH